MSETSPTTSDVPVPRAANAADVAAIVLVVVAVWWVLVARPVGLFSGLGRSFSPVIDPVHRGQRAGRPASRVAEAERRLAVVACRAIASERGRIWRRRAARS